MTAGRGGWDMSKLEDFGVIEDPNARFRKYVASAAKVPPKVRAAWWKETLKRDPEILKFFQADDLKKR